MKIALAQLNFTVGDIKSNTDKIIATINRAKSEGVDLVVFAEFAISGTPAYGLLTKTTFLSLCEEAVESIASKCRGIAAIVGTPYLGYERGILAKKASISHFAFHNSYFILYLCHVFTIPQV